MLQRHYQLLSKMSVDSVFDAHWKEEVEDNVNGYSSLSEEVADVGSRRLFKFRSGTHSLNEELGRHRGREGKAECSLCRNECENVSHVLWECSAYSSTRANFMKKLQELLENDYEDFESLENVKKSSYVLAVSCGRVSSMDCLTWLRNIL